MSPRCHPGAVRPPLPAPPSDAPDRGEREAFDLPQVQLIVESNSTMGGGGSALGGGHLAKFLIPSADSLGVNLFK